jgi:hypothetical protein
MKLFIYKFFISLFLFYVFFELTLGKRIDYITNKLDAFSDHQSRIEFKEKLKLELKKANQKENYFTEEERILISNFIKKISSELELNK